MGVVIWNGHLPSSNAVAGVPVTSAYSALLLVVLAAIVLDGRSDPVEENGQLLLMGDTEAKEEADDDDFSALLLNAGEKAPAESAPASRGTTESAFIFIFFICASDVMH